MNTRARQSGKVGIFVLLVLIILVVNFWDSIFPVDVGPEILSVESFECVFALGDSAGVSGRSDGVAGRFDISVMNLSEETLTDIFVKITARHPDSRNNTRSLVTQLSPARLRPGRLGRFKGSIKAPKMAAANASVDKLLCLMEIGRMRDGELQAIGVRINGLDLVSATKAAPPVIL